MDIYYLAPIYGVPYRFSYQHILLLLISISYILALSMILRQKSFNSQRLVLLFLIIISSLIFVGRMYFGWEGARIYNKGSKTTLLPLELCNINIFITLIALLINNKRLNNYLYYVSLLGASISLIIFPDCHMWPDKTIFHYMFLDYYFIHTQLVAIPIVMIVCGWFRPDFKEILWMILFVFIYFTFAFLMSALLRNFESFKTANYMYTFDHTNLPILKHLYAFIPLPYIYELPLIILVAIVFGLMGLPFIMSNKKGQKYE